jgi:hypothetical protein
MQFALFFITRPEKVYSFFLPEAKATREWILKEVFFIWG